MIELRHLRYFIAVAEELHFGRAAQMLCIAQPSLSRQIQNLEQELGTLLLQRSKRSVSLTAAGKLYLERARQIVEQVTRAGNDALRVANGETGALKVAFIHSSTYNLTPAILNIFARAHPGIMLDLMEMTVIGQIEALVRGEVDIGLLRPPVNDKALAWETVLHESFVLAVPENHPLANRKIVSVQELREEPFILFSRPQSPLLHSRIIDLCEAAGFMPRVAQKAIQIHTVLGLVGAGLGIALLPEAARQLNLPRVRFLKTREHIEPVEVAIAWRRDNPNPALSPFRKAVKEAAHNKQTQRRGQGGQV